MFWFILGHIAVFFQLNSQFKWDWAKDHPWVLALAGFPVSFFYIWGTKYTVEGFEGLLWPARFVGFSMGMIVYAFGVSWMFNQGMTPKTVVSLTLAVMLVCIQVLWK